MKRVLYFIIILFACGLFSCVDDFEEINSDPHALEVSPAPLFSRTLMLISSDKQQVWHIDLGICAAAVQHLAGAWDASTGGQYRPVTVDVFNALWDNYYTIGINNINDVIERTAESETYHNLHYAARIWRVYMFSRLTDMYGDIPYFEASKGYSDQNFTPRFDPQSEIYEDFFSELQIAVNNLDNTKDEIQGDLLYNGDVESWIRFGNSLRLRLGFRLVQKDLTEAETQVRAAISGNLISDNSENCAIPYADYSGTSGEFRGNGIGQLFAENDRDQGMAGFRLANTLVDYMKASNDPRLFIYGRMYDYLSSDYVDITDWFSTLDDFYEGIPHGNYWWNDAPTANGGYADWGHWYNAGELNGGPADGYWHDYGARYLMPSEYFAHPGNPFNVFTYGEVELLLAEAAARGWGASDAETHFTNGIEAFCNLIPEVLNGAPSIDATEINTFLNTIASPFPTDLDAQLELINSQLWVAHYLDPLEAYSNWRRSGYPDLQPYQGDQQGWNPPGESSIPRRFKYPNYISFYNPDNYNDAINRAPLSGEDSWTESVWWDAN